MRVAGQSIEVDGLSCRLAVYAIRQLAPKKWRFTVLRDDVYATMPTEAERNAIVGSVPQDAPLIVVSCSAKRSAMEQAAFVLRSYQDEIEDGKIDAVKMKPGSVTFLQTT